MTDPMGQFGLIVAGTVIVLVALQMFYRAYIGDLDRWLELQSLHRLLRTTVVALGRFGLAARGVVFCAGGAILIEAAIQRRPWRVRAPRRHATNDWRRESRCAAPGDRWARFRCIRGCRALSASYRRINI